MAGVYDLAIDLLRDGCYNGARLMEKRDGLLVGLLRCIKNVWDASRFNRFKRASTVTLGFGHTIANASPGRQLKPV